ncbi:hypothetical protein IQ07DRAFT_585019 [Pyrenochaeta sp. DS3sAY3a]|nr:hypothetical protein IQ07DRAFT_585019 [Pyrenochaeta sp. DS3sAY3a]
MLHRSSPLLEAPAAHPSSQHRPLIDPDYLSIPVRHATNPRSSPFSSNRRCSPALKTHQMHQTAAVADVRPHCWLFVCKLHMGLHRSEQRPRKTMQQCLFLLYYVRAHIVVCLEKQAILPAPAICIALHPFTALLHRSTKATQRGAPSSASTRLA